MIITIIQGMWKDGNKKKNYCEGACNRVVLWNFRLHFEPLDLLPLWITLTKVQAPCMDNTMSMCYDKVEMRTKVSKKMSLFIKN